MAKAGKFAALAQFRQEQHVDEAIPLSGQAAQAEAIRRETAEASLEPIASADAPQDRTLAPTPDELVAQTRPTSMPTEKEAENEISAPAKQQSQHLADKPQRPRGRPPGKRSDPDWKLFSHFLKRSTQRQATAILFEQDDGRDLSDVLQNLLETWVFHERSKI